MGALHSLELFKANRPLGMSLSPRASASDRSRREDRVAPLRLPRAGWVRAPRTSAPGSQGKGAVAAGRACSQGKQLSLQEGSSHSPRGSLPLPSHMSPPSPSHATCSRALPFMLICFPLQKDLLSSLRSATSRPHAAVTHPLVPQTPPKTAWLREDGKPMQKANAPKSPWCTAQKQYFIHYCHDGAQKMFEA